MAEENKIDSTMTEAAGQEQALGEQEAASAAESLTEDAAGATEVQPTEAELLTKELEEARSKLDQMLRIVAEAENSKKRMEREKEKLLKYAGEGILKELLNTADNLDRALEQGKVVGGDPEQKLVALLAGVELTKKGLEAMLERFGVTALASLGQPFNPDQMDALTMEASEDVPANHVVREFARGFVFKDRVLRHAQVVVSSGGGSK